MLSGICCVRQVAPNAMNSYRWAVSVRRPDGVRTTRVRTTPVRAGRRHTMGMLSRVIKGGIAVKAIQMIKREASKPQNQRKAREFAARVREQRRSR